jgi:hypothetical protein
MNTSLHKKLAKVLTELVTIEPLESGGLCYFCIEDDGGHESDCAIILSKEILSEITAKEKT